MQQEAARQAIAQIAHLAQTWPIKRSWLPLNNRITSAAAAASTTTTSSTRTSSPLLTLVSYNLLAQHLIRRKMFMYCSKDTLRLHHRRQQLTAELLSYQADILALQEVDADLYHEHYQAVLGSHGYDGRFGTADDKGHGCALFFKRDRFDVADYELMQYADMAKEYDDEQTHNEMNKANIAQITHTHAQTTAQRRRSRSDSRTSSAARSHRNQHSSLLASTAPLRSAAAM